MEMQCDFCLNDYDSVNFRATTFNLNIEALIVYVYGCYTLKTTKSIDQFAFNLRSLSFFFFISDNYV